MTSPAGQPGTPQTPPAAAAPQVNLPSAGTPQTPPAPPAPPVVDHADATPESHADDAGVERFGSRDRLTDLKAAQGPLQPTVDDAAGVERIVGPAVDDNWRPARVEPHPDEVAHLERVREHQASRRDERLAATQAPGERVKEGVEVLRGANDAERSNA